MLGAMEALLEGLLELILGPLVELLLSMIGQIFGELGSHTLAAYRKPRPRRPVVSAIGHAFFGALLGGLSLLVLDHSMAHTFSGRLASLIVSPLLAGTLTALIGLRRKRGGRPTVMLESFSYGLLFAFSFSLVRFLATMP